MQQHTSTPNAAAAKSNPKPPAPSNDRQHPKHGEHTYIQRNRAKQHRIQPGTGIASAPQAPAAEAASAPEIRAGAGSRRPKAGQGRRDGVGSRRCERGSRRGRLPISSGEGSSPCRAAAARCRRGGVSGGWGSSSAPSPSPPRRAERRRRWDRGGRICRGVAPTIP
jgi:hypothetical protein